MLSKYFAHHLINHPHFQTPNSIPFKTRFWSVLRDLQKKNKGSVSCFNISAPFPFTVNEKKNRKIFSAPFPFTVNEKKNRKISFRE